MQDQPLEYVITLCTRAPMNQVLVILKDRPSWQKNKINLPGGLIESGETPEQAGIRELQEETGLSCSHIHKLGTIKDRNLTIYCMSAGAQWTDAPLQKRPQETEEPLWLPMEKLLKDPRLIPNLRVVIPLMFVGASDWTIFDDATADLDKDHTIHVTLYR